jgi:hypothetical protein
MPLREKGSLPLTFIPYNARNSISPRLSLRKPEDLCSHLPFQRVFETRQFLKSAFVFFVFS